MFPNQRSNLYPLSGNSRVLTTGAPRKSQKALKSTFSDISIASLAFFWFPFPWNTFYHSLIFNLYVSLDLKWVSCRQHIYGSCFVSIQPVCVFWLEHVVHLHLRSLLMYVPNTILFIVLDLLVRSFFPFLLLLFSPVIWWLSLVLCLDSSFFFVCISEMFVYCKAFIYLYIYIYMYTHC